MKKSDFADDPIYYDKKFIERGMRRGLQRAHQKEQLGNRKADFTKFGKQYFP